jgi:phosphotransferase system HPr (HPr) family protein
VALESSPDHRVREVRVALPAGVDLHARPAATLVKTAMRFRARITLLDGAREADAKSILSVMALGARGGTELRLRASGDDAAAALDALSACVATLA